MNKLKPLISLIPFIGIIYLLSYNEKDQQRAEFLYEYSQTLFIVAIFIQFVSMITLASFLTK